MSTPVSLRTVNHTYLCAEGGGGREVVANRDGVGPWETWTATTQPDGTVTLQAHNGMYLCAELNGSLIANRPGAGPWESFRVETHGAEIALISHHGKYLSVPGGGGLPDPVTCDRPLPDQNPSSVPGSWELLTSSADIGMPTSHPDPLVGQLTTDGDRCYRDDTGPRLVTCYHGGDLFALFCAGKVDTVRGVLAEVAQAGYHVVRSWVCLNDALDPGNVWVGPDYLGVGPTHTPDYTGKLVEFADLLSDYELRWHMAAGGLDGMTTAQEEDMFRQWANAMDEAGPEKWALVEAVNEARDTTDNDFDSSPAHLEHLINIVRDRHPYVLYTLTSYTGTEDPALLKPYQPDWARLTYYHGYRGGEMDDKIRHRVSMALESGLGRLFWDGEPGGPWNRQGIPGDPLTSVSAQDNDHEYDDESVAAMHLGSLIGHGATAFMCATGVRHYIAPSTFPGFWSMPRIFRVVPDDAQTGECVHGGRANSPFEATTNGDGHIGRADSLLLADGRVVTLFYSERPGVYDYRLRQGVTGYLIHPGSAAIVADVNLQAGQYLPIEMTWARLFVGRIGAVATYSSPKPPRRRPRP